MPPWSPTIEAVPERPQMGMNRKGSKRLNATRGLSGPQPGVEKETLADVSILPSWIVHTLCRVFANVEVMKSTSTAAENQAGRDTD